MCSTKSMALLSRFASPFVSVVPIIHSEHLILLIVVNLGEILQVAALAIAVIYIIVNPNRMYVSRVMDAYTSKAIQVNETPV